MNRRSFLAGVGAMTVGGSALLASGAYSRAESQRAVTIETVGDDDAYLRLIYADADVDCEGQVTLVELTNQFKDVITDVTVTYASSNDDVTVGSVTEPQTLRVGESSEVLLREVDCTSPEPVTTTVTFDIQIEGPDLDATVKGRSIEITCSCLQQFDATGISFVAFCAGGEPVTVTDITVTHVKDETEPTGIAWTSEQPVEEVVVKGGQEWYSYHYPGGATSGSEVLMDAGTATSTNTEGRCPQSPCVDVAGTKIDEADDIFDVATQEVTKENC